MTAAGILSRDIAAYALFAVAFLLALRSAWQFEPIRSHIPYDFQSPIVRRRRTVRPRRIPAELGQVDYELHLMRSTKGAVRFLGKIAKEMTRNAANVRQQTERIPELKDKSVQTRHSAYARMGRLFRKHARRLARAEARYRVENEAVVSNMQKLLETAVPGQDFERAVEATAALRKSTLANKTSITDYKNAIQVLRNQSVSQAVNGACDELLMVLDRMIENTDTVITYADWVAELSASRQIAQNALPASGDI
jgi:hypothetical protein